MLAPLIFKCTLLIVPPTNTSLTQLTDALPMSGHRSRLPGPQRAHQDTLARMERELAAAAQRAERAERALAAKDGDLAQVKH